MFGQVHYNALALSGLLTSSESGILEKRLGLEKSGEQLNCKIFLGVYYDKISVSPPWRKRMEQTESFYRLDRRRIERQGTRRG